VFLLGAAAGVADRAAKNIHQRWPLINVVGTYSPPLGFERDAAENENILDRIEQSQPDVLIVGLGAPKQELWVHAHRNRIAAPVALCVGATIDFLAGEKPRAPVWMRRVGLEWLHRLASEPKRLARRYLRDARIFPRLIWKEWLRQV
jgi:N-acetylglucosaminyldiphosphoundecaprenol N-acetyl-beta-D-mannosaminyltransferase